jgi:DNA invertase Pin-like site-specific DNA recombinase
MRKYISSHHSMVGHALAHSNRKEPFMAQANQSSKIRAMAKAGKTNGAIAKKLGIRYQTVWRTLNRPFQGKIPQQELINMGIRQVENPLLEKVDGE